MAVGQKPKKKKNEKGDEDSLEALELLPTSAKVPESLEKENIPPNKTYKDTKYVIKQEGGIPLIGAKKQGVMAAVESIAEYGVMTRDASYTPTDPTLDVSLSLYSNSIVYKQSSVIKTQK